MTQTAGLLAQPDGVRCFDEKGPAGTPARRAAGAPGFARSSGAVLPLRTEPADEACGPLRRPVNDVQATLEWFQRTDRYDGSSNHRSAKPVDVPHPTCRHEAGAACAIDTPSARLSFPNPVQGRPRKAGYRVPAAAQGDHGPWLLLASTSGLSARPHTCDPESVLGGEIRTKP